MTVHQLRPEPAPPLRLLRIPNTPLPAVFEMPFEYGWQEYDRWIRIEDCARANREARGWL
jgi:hypothetical protein